MTLWFTNENIVGYSSNKIYPSACYNFKEALHAQDNTKFILGTWFTGDFITTSLQSSSMDTLK